MRIAIIVGVLVLAASASADVPGVSGKLFDSGRFFDIEEAIAYRDEGGVRIAISSSRFDRFQFAADGRLEPGDIRRHRDQHRLSTVEFELDEGGAFRRFHTARVADVERGRSPVGGWQLEALDGDRVTARWAYGQSDLRIDLPIQPADMVMPGVEAPTDAGPALTLLAYIDAHARNDVDRVLALSHSPRRLLQITEAGREAVRKSVEHSLLMEDPKVASVRVDGDIAEVHFSIELLTGPANRRAFLARFDGEWIVQGIGDPRRP